MMTQLLLAVLAAILAVAVVLSWLAARQWRRRVGQEMQTDAQWWDTFLKRVRRP